MIWQCDILSRHRMNIFLVELIIKKFSITRGNRPTIGSLSSIVKSSTA